MKYVFAIILFATSIYLTGCTKKFLEKPQGSDLNVDSVFSGKQKALAAIAQAYSQSLTSGIIIWDASAGRDYGATGTLTHLSGELNAIKFYWEGSFQIQRSGLTANDGSGNARASGNFINNYYAIRHNQVVAENIDKVPDMNETEKKQVRAEMTILTAYRYMELLKRYGGVPIVRNPLTLTDNLNTPRATVKETVDYIVTLCDSVQPDLPDAYEAANVGRVTKGVAMCVKAETLMFAARPLFNSATPYLSTAGIENLVCLGNYDANRWQNAVDANLAVLNWALANNYKIINTGKPFDDFGTAVATPSNPEILLAYKYQGNLSFYDPHDQPGGANAMSFDMLSQFYKADGNDQAWSTTAAPYSQYWAKMQEMEPRYKVSAIAAGQQAWNNPGSYRWSPAVLAGSSNWDGSRGTEGCGRRAKFWYMAGERRWCEYPLYRLAEIYLNLAEAYNELGNAPEALKNLNVIRKRAGLPDVTETDQLKLRKIIQREWAIEFYEEGHRYFDVKHWKHENIGNGIIGGPKSGFLFTYTSPTAIGTSASDYSTYVTKVMYTGFWSQNQYLEPFPIREVNIGAIKQNPGY